MSNNCLNCKYQPEWGRVEGTGIYQRQCGACKWFKKYKVRSPACCQIIPQMIWRFPDNSGIHSDCPTWEPDK